jgi:hypothetical protein
MSYSVKLEKLAKEKQEARNIVLQVLNFGISEQQKLDIIHGISMSLESNDAMKDINKVLKTYRETINKDEEEDNNSKDNNKIILD